MKKYQIIHDVVRSADFVKIIPKTARTGRIYLLAATLAAACNGDIAAMGTIWGLLTKDFINISKETKK